MNIREKVKLINKKNSKLNRLAVFRSNKYMYGQIIDIKGDTVLSISSKMIKDCKTKSEQVEKLGTEIGKAAIAKKITEVIFDRNRLNYHGQVKLFADGARKAGLKF